LNLIVAFLALETLAVLETGIEVIEMTTRGQSDMAKAALNDPHTARIAELSRVTD